MEPGLRSLVPDLFLKLMLILGRNDHLFWSPIKQLFSDWGLIGFIARYGESIWIINFD